MLTFNYKKAAGVTIAIGIGALLNYLIFSFRDDGIIHPPLKDKEKAELNINDLRGDILNLKFYPEIVGKWDSSRNDENSSTYVSIRLKEDGTFYYENYFINHIVEDFDRKEGSFELFNNTIRLRDKDVGTDFRFGESFYILEDDKLQLIPFAAIKKPGPNITNMYSGLGSWITTLKKINP